MTQSLSLQLGEMITELLRRSGATQVEQFAALDVARALVPVSGATLCEAAAPARPEEAK
jgi:hypothetical protein